MSQPESTNAIDSLTEAGLSATRILLDAFEEIARTVSAANPLLAQQQTSCCDIPPACWLPRDFGTYESSACPCGTALLRVQVTNCQPVRSEIKIDARGDSGLEIKLTPDNATLEPMERKWFTVAVTIPEDACKGHAYELVVWVAGCNEHYGRWIVRVADGSSGTCVEGALDDCPDHVHHWYDHFYCKRSCFSNLRQRGS